MSKLTVLAVLAGLATVATTLPSAAQFTHGFTPNNPGGPGGSSVNECAYQLDYMPRVTKAKIEQISGQPVFLIPVCEDELLGKRDAYGALFRMGNVETLRLPIAHNSTLMAALTAEGYDQHDVVALRFGGGDSIVLFVHQRNMR